MRFSFPVSAPGSHTGRRNFLTVALAAAAVTAARVVSAAELPSPSGEVVLRVSGAIRRRNSPGGARFDLEALEGLGLRDVVTSTPWFEGRTRFRGVPLSALMQAVEPAAGAGRAVVSALNDYRGDLPIADFASYGPILATTKDGNRMRVEDLGPLFIVYPYDDLPEAVRPILHTRSVWQVAEIEVR